MLKFRYTGDIPDIINNTADNDVYEGNLSHYLRAVFKAPNIHHGYHGLRHMLHVTWVGYQACVYYRKLGQLTLRRARNALIAFLFHDYGHPGRPGNDAENIRVAVKAMRSNLLTEDKAFADDIENIMWASEWPHVVLCD